MGIYFGQNNKMVFDCRDGSKVINSNCFTYYGLFNFDGNANILVRPVSTSDVSGNRAIKWKMWLDQESGYTACKVFCFWPSGTYSETCNIGLNNNEIIIQTKYLSTSLKYSLSGLSNNILNCEVKKSGETIDYFKVNDISLSSTGSGSFLGGNGDAWYISFAGLYLATIWDIRVIDSDTQILKDGFLGYPNGNTSNAWLNTVEGSSGETALTNPNGAGVRNL